LFDQNLRLGARTKPFEAETLVAELAVEALRDAILPRLAGFDQCHTDALRDDPRSRALRAGASAISPPSATSTSGSTASTFSQAGGRCAVPIGHHRSYAPGQERVRRPDRRCARGAILEGATPRP